MAPLVGLHVLAACGTSAPETEPPRVPFGELPTRYVIHFIAPIDTASTRQEPRKMFDRASVPAGNMLFRSTRVPDADHYFFQANEISGVGPDKPGKNM